MHFQGSSKRGNVVVASDPQWRGLFILYFSGGGLVLNWERKVVKTADLRLPGFMLGPHEPPNSYGPHEHAHMNYYLIKQGRGRGFGPRVAGIISMIFLVWRSCF